MRSISITGITLIFGVLVLSTGTKAASRGRNRSNTEASSWLHYHDSATGLSFDYPPDLRIRQRDPHTFGLPDAEEITDLLGDTSANANTVVLRFIVNRGRATPETAAEKEREMRDTVSKANDPWESVTSMQLDGHEALKTVECGRAACHWRVHILQPRDCVILSLLSGADAEEALPPPHNGVFPLLSIIESVHFDERTTRNP
jgi:hypothetical protein